LGFTVTPLTAGLAIQASALWVVTLPGTNDADPAGGYSDDIILDSLVFPGATFNNPLGQFRSVIHARVVSGRDFVNAEYGDDDDGSDGNPHPYVTAGIVNEGETPSDDLRQSTDPAIQDPAITAAFGGFSLSQGIDGENQDYTIDIIFAAGIADDDDINRDATPEILFFERGANSSVRVQLITGGTIGAPTLSPNHIDVLHNDNGTNDYYRSDVFIDTVEIGSAQRLGVVGMDLSDFFNGNVTQAYGMRISSIAAGADLYGVFLSATDPNAQFLPLPPGLQMPEPATYGLVGLGLVAVWWRRRPCKVWPRP
jgi:hypothetical protein